MKILLTFLLGLIAISVNGANPSFGDFNTGQFGTTGNKVVVKAGSQITNPVIRGSFTNDQGTGAYFTDGSGLLKGQVTPYTGPNIPGLQLHASDVKVLELLTNLVSFSQNAAFAGTITGNGYGLTNLPTTSLSNFLFATSSHVPGREFVEWTITEQDPATNNTYGFRVIQTETSGENSLTNGHGAGIFEVLIQNGNSQNYKERLSGLYGYIHHSGSGGVGDGRGILSVVQNASSGRITNGYGFYSTGQNVSSGQMQNYNDFFAHTFINTGGGPGPSNIYAFRVEGNTAGSNNFGFYSPGGDSNYLAALTTTNINTTTAAVSGPATVGTTLTFPATATTNTIGVLFGSGSSGFSLYRYQSSGYAMDFGSLRMGGDIVFNGNNAFDVGSFSTKARQIIGVGGYLATTYANTVYATNIIAMATNYTAANFVPTAGLVKIVSSNGALYSVTQLSTNLIAGP